MALTLVHEKFKNLIDGLTGQTAYPVYIPENADLPAYMFSMESIARDIESNLKNTTVSAHVFNVHVAAKEFSTCHELTQNLINGLDQYTEGSSGTFLLTLVEDGQDGYDPDIDAFTTSLVISVRVKET